MHFKSHKLCLAVRCSGIAVAAMAYSAAGHGQSSVTLYGALDTGLFYQSTSAASFSPKAPNLGKLYSLKDAGIYASFWGMKGNEDLGGGYSSHFQLQGAFNTTNGKLGLGDSGAPTSSLFNQVASVGLAGPFGSIDMGRQITSMFWVMRDTDVRNAEYFGSTLISWIGMNSTAGWSGGSTNAPVGSLFESNAIIYKSPNYRGVTGTLEYAPGGVAGDFQANTRESASLEYSNYGLNMAALYYNGHDTNPIPLTAAATGVDNNRMIYVGARYTISGVSMSTSFANGRNPAASNRVNIDMYTAGLGYQFLPKLSVTSGVYYLKDTNNSANRSTMVALAADYSVSQATTLYAEVGHVNNRGDMTQALTYGEPVAPGMSTTAVDFGIRHRF